MADSCGPSNAGKGLIQHFDRNRSLQQDRFVNLPPAPGQTSFRSAQNAPAADASFAAFQAGPAVPGLANGPVPHVQPLTNVTNRPVHGASQPAGHAGHEVPAWVQDFQRMQMGTNGHASPVNGMPAAFHHDMQNIGPSHNGPLHGASSQMAAGASYNTAMNNMAMAAAHLAGPGVMAPMAHQSAAYQPATSFVTGNTQPSNVQPRYAHYPTSVLAATTDEALEAAFAAYDDDFHAHMNDWMDQHGPQNDEQSEQATGMQRTDEISPEEMDEIDATMRAIADEQDQQEQLRLNDDSGLIADQQEHREAPANTEGEDFRRAALDILNTVSHNDSEKFKNSSFVELMRRISNREVVLQGENLVETSTGKVIGGDEDASNTDGAAPAGGDQPEDSGKGKERAQ